MIKKIYETPEMCVHEFDESILCSTGFSAPTGEIFPGIDIDPDEMD